MWSIPEVPYYYLAGPMRGYDEFNFPAFHRISAELRRRGYVIVSPAEKDEDRGYDFTGTDGSQEALDAQAFDIDEALQLDISIIANKLCLGVICMQGWLESSGARAETAYAWATGRKVYRYFEPIFAPDEDDDWRGRYADEDHVLTEMLKPTLRIDYAGKQHDRWENTNAAAPSAS